MANVVLLPGCTIELLALTAPLASVTTMSWGALPSLTRNRVVPDFTSIVLGVNLNSDIDTFVEPAGCRAPAAAPPPPPQAASASTSRPATTAFRPRRDAGGFRSEVAAPLSATNRPNSIHATASETGTLNSSIAIGGPNARPALTRGSPPPWSR